MPLKDISDPFQVLSCTLIHRIFSYLPLAVVHGSMPLVSKMLRDIVDSSPVTHISVELKSPTSAGSFAVWLQSHGSRLEQLSVTGPSLFGLAAKLSLAEAIACSCSNLKDLQLSLPLSPQHEAAVFAALAPLLPTLKALTVHYTSGPGTTDVCFEAAGLDGPGGEYIYIGYEDAIEHISNNTQSVQTALGSATNLQSLVITGEALGDSKALQGLTALTRLDLATAAASRLGNALANLPNLQHVCLSRYIRLGDYFGPLQRLRQAFTNRLATSLAGCRQLTTLSLVELKPDDTSISLLAPLGQLQQLKELDLAGCLLSAQQLLPLTACSELSKLSLARNSLTMSEDGSSSSSTTDPLLLLLSQLIGLYSLDVSGCELASLQPIYYCCTGLTALYAGAHRSAYHPNQITSSDLAGVSNLQSLCMLDLSSNKLDHSCLQYLASLTQLTFLSLAENNLDHNITDPYPTSNSSSSTYVTAESENDAGDSDSITSNSDGGCSCYQGHTSGLQHLTGMQQLLHLDLSSCCLADVSPLGHLTGLTCVKLGYTGFRRFGYNKLTPASFKAIGQLTGLQHLKLNYCRGQHTQLPEEASHLSALKQLTYLDVSGCWDACWQIMQQSDPASIAGTTPSPDGYYHDVGDSIAFPPVLKGGDGCSREDGHAGLFPCLQELQMLLQDHTALPKVAACCSNLRLLHMSDSGQQMQGIVKGFDALQRLTGLTSLSVDSIEPLQRVDQLATLTGLRHLKFGIADVSPAEHILALTALSQLTCLNIQVGEWHDEVLVGCTFSALPEYAQVLLGQWQVALPYTWIESGVVE